MNEGKTVMVFSDSHDLALEMLGIGRELADKTQAELATVVIGHNASQKADELAKHGADKVYLADHPSLQHYQAETYITILHELTMKCGAGILLIGSTRNGKPLAARVATRIGAGCVPDCTRLSIDDTGRLVGERITYGGNAMTRVTFRSKPQIATIPARAFEKTGPYDRNGLVLRLDAKIEKPKVEIVERKPLETSNVRIEEADVIISCGRGLGKKEDRVLLEELSTVLCGQVGCSRPLAEDRKWFTEWVGLSGHKVKPKLYIACGISGVIQHVAGIRDSKVIVAINKDPEAPIFEIADYGVVGNMYEVLPALKEALKQQLQR